MRNLDGELEASWKGFRHVHLSWGIGIPGAEDKSCCFFFFMSNLHLHRTRRCSTHYYLGM
jgi:hypothetical protein